MRFLNILFLPMTSILIPSLYGDTDSLMVQVALEQRGNSVFRWVGDNFPQKQTASFYVGKNTDKWRTHFPSSGTNTVDVVWLRRPRWPLMPASLHDNDKDIAEQECRTFIQSFFHASWQNAYWANSLYSRRRAGSKMLQLREAARIGMNVPETLISNDPLDIRHFLREHKGSVIVKALSGGDWKEDNRRFVSYTSELSEAELPHEIQIQSCPCIFQKKIEKDFEVRLVFFGAHSVAVKLNSQKTHDGKLDWRIADARSLKIEEIVLPRSVYTQCRELMKILGIVHGSFDFAVTSSGSWIFFEVNEGGQFLWLEDYAPKIPMLEIATQFFSEPDDDFILKSNSKFVTVRDVVRTADYKRYTQLDAENLASINMPATL